MYHSAVLHEAANRVRGVTAKIGRIFSGTEWKAIMISPAVDLPFMFPGLFFMAKKQYWSFIKHRTGISLPQSISMLHFRVTVTW